MATSEIGDRAPREVLWDSDELSAVSVACATLNGRQVVVAGGGNFDTSESIGVWDLATGTPVREPWRCTTNSRQRTFGVISAVACATLSDGPVVVYGTYAVSTLFVHDLATGTPVCTITTGNSIVSAVAVPKGYPVAISGHNDGTVRVWNLDTGSLRRAMDAGHTGTVAAVARTVLNGRPVVVSAGRDDGTLRMSDAFGLPLNTLHAVHARPGHGCGVRALSCATLNGGPIAVTGGVDETVRVWDLSTGELRHTLTGHTGWVSAATCAMLNGHLIAVTGDEDGAVRVWDLATGNVESVYEFSEPVCTLACASDTLVVGYGRDWKQDRVAAMRCRGLCEV